MDSPAWVLNHPSVEVFEPSSHAVHSTALVINAHTQVRLVVKADVQGSVEAVVAALADLGVPGVTAKV